MPFNRRSLVPFRFLISLIAILLLNISISDNIYSSVATVKARHNVWNVPGLSPQVFELALRAADTAQAQRVSGSNILGIIDYSLPSTARRFWVLDLETRRVLFHEFVAHGRGSGDTYATSFSNKAQSYKSSLGLFITESTYRGKHDLSLRLHGLEPGINDNARSRAIVIHGAWYVDEGMISKQGRMGRSLGCPSVKESVARPLIDTLKDGNLIFAYYPDDHWLSTSKFLNR